jgi:tetratricopeptide (TPR) repeat protein
VPLVFTYLIRSGVIDFFHCALQEAVQKRYCSIPEQQQRWHLRLANYFENQTLNARVADELLWQLEKANALKRLEKCISKLPMFLQLRQNKRGLSLRGYLDHLGCIYPDIHKSLNNLASLVEHKGYYDEAIDLLWVVYDIRKKILGFYHSDTQNSQYKLFSLLKKEGHYQLVRELEYNELEINDPDTLNDMLTLSSYTRPPIR